MVWVVFALVTLATLGAMLWPLLRGRSAATGRSDYDMLVYRDQLAEVDREVESGLLTEEQAAAVRLEVQRRLLAAASAGEGDKAPGTWGGRRIAAIAVAVIVPLVGFSIYLGLGKPSQPDMPYAEAMAKRMNMPAAEAKRMLEQVDSLAAKMKNNPQDANGWMMLGRSYNALGRYQDAAQALRHAIQNGMDDAETWSAFGEAIALSNEAQVIPEARQAFLASLERNPKNVAARYYLGLAHAQIGDTRKAIAVWRGIEEDSPAQAPWLPQIRQQIAVAAKEAGIDPTTVKSEMPSGVGTSGATAGAGLPAGHPTGASGPNEEQLKMIRGMVAQLDEKLKANPNDADGWVRLGRSYRVLGELPKAKDAYGKAVKLKPDDLELKMAYADTLIAQMGDDDKLPTEFVTTMRDVLRIAPDNQDALYYVGLGAMQQGNRKEARSQWTKLLDKLDPQSPEHAELKKQIDELGTGG